MVLHTSDFAGMGDASSIDSVTYKTVKNMILKLTVNFTLKLEFLIVVLRVKLNQCSMKDLCCVHKR